MSRGEKIKSNFKNKNILSLDQFDKKSIDLLFKRVQQITEIIQVEKRNQLLEKYVAALLFYEPSSRTFSSFSSAIKHLGGQTIEYQNPSQTSSAVKGETLEDSIKTFENYCNLIVIRHPENGAAERAAEATESISVINAGDGSGEHPTQALLDMYTIFERFGKLQTIKGLIAGDLLNGRTVHSLLKGLSYYPGNTVYLLSPKSLRIKATLLHHLQDKGLRVIEVTHAKDIPKDCQFWYWTRVQKERFKKVEDYNTVKDSFILTLKLLKEKGNKEMIIMHPLPRVNEISTAVDDDPRAVYFRKQMKNGLYVRMALVASVLGEM